MVKGKSLPSIFQEDQYEQRIASIRLWGNWNQDGTENVEPWWVLKDVCTVLDLSNPSKIADKLDDDDQAKYCLGRQGDTDIISERGLYNVILLSRKLEAKKFKRWVTHEVLPTIRKHSAYVIAAKLEEIMNTPDTWITVLTALKEERAAKDRLELEAAQNTPKVIFADAVSVSEGTILIGELAKILKGNGLEIGQNRLFERLRQDGYLIKRKGTDYNTPTQRAMELGLFSKGNRHHSLGRSCHH